MDVARAASKARSSRLDRTDYAQLVFVVKFSVADLARACGVTERQLERYFRFRFGMRPREFIQRQRLAKAKQQLGAGDPVKEVCFTRGFRQPTNFARAYVRFYGYPPSKERAQAP